MTDPRAILSAAGVSLPDVEEYRQAVLEPIGYEAQSVADRADAALVSVSRELAKYKWVAEHDWAWDGKEEGPMPRMYFAQLLLARYEEAQHE